ncbi:MAG TPA: hypothetical protein VGK41_05580 [Solirubrobacterales bacterium]
MTEPYSKEWSENPADFDFDLIASALLDQGWDEKEIAVTFDEGTRVWLVATVHTPTKTLIEGALHVSLVTYAATGLAHDMSRKLKAELDDA